MTAQVVSETPLQTPLQAPLNPFEKYMPKPQVSYPNVAATSVPFLKKVFVQTWGCQMNVADTERMLALLGRHNYRLTESVDEADLVLLNTCHIREKARHKLLSRLGELKPLKVAKPEMILAVAGCVAQAEAKILAQEAPFVDMIFGPDQIEDLPTLLEQAVTKVESESALQAETFGGNGGPSRTRHRPFVDTQFKKNEGYSIPIDVVPPWMDETKNEVTKYINIIKGCNNFCTFCVVPFTRGREKSREINEVLDEARYFVSKGIKELVLLGQNVNSYGLDLLEQQDKAYKPAENGGLPFAELLYKVAAIEGVERIRFTTSNPHDFTHQLAQAFADLPQLCNAFHLPVQSGSNAMLERMNRQYTREMYFERVNWIRAVRPDIAFSTDLIVGFPGETEADFEDTLDLVRRMKYAFVFAFKYSPRRGTPAARFKDQVPDDVADARLQRLLVLQREETERQNRAEVGQTRSVMVMYRNKKEADTWYGRTYEGRLVKVQSSQNLLGLTLPVLITGANLTAIEGFPVQ